MSSETRDSLWRTLRWSILAAVVVGALAGVYLAYKLGQESVFSALYLVPGSYSNYIEGGRIAFTYGVECYQLKPTRYHLDILLGDRKISERDFVLCSPERKREERVEITGIRGALSFPVKLRLVLTYGNRAEEVHFWIKGYRGGNSSG